jgi:hypothetical protein
MVKLGYVRKRYKDTQYIDIFNNDIYNDVRMLEIMTGSIKTLVIMLFRIIR